MTRPLKTLVKRMQGTPYLRPAVAPLYAARNAYRAVTVRYFLDRVIRRVRESGRPRDLDALIDLCLWGFHGLISPIQNREELTRLAAEVETLRPKRVIEIGTASGGTLFVSARLSADDATLLSIDLPGGPGGGGYDEWRVPLYKGFALPGQTIELVRDDSHDPARLDDVRKAFGGEPVDYLFIDGDHSYEGVKQDFEMYSPFVRRPGGLVAFHDIVYTEGVAKYWNEIKGGYNSEEVIASEGTVFGIGLIRF